MKYMMLICRDPSIELSPQDRASMPGWVSAWVEEMDSRGIRLQGDLFQPASDARTVRIRNGQVQLANGPYADTREQSAATTSSTVPTSTRPLRWRQNTR